MIWNSLLSRSLFIILATFFCRCKTPFSMVGPSKTIVINQGDSVLKFSVLEPEKVINPIESRDYFWFKSGKIWRTEGAFAGKLLDGDYLLFGPGGQLLQQGEFRKGRRVGAWKNWYNGGNIYGREKYRNGKLAGKVIFYDLDGHPMLVSRFNKGRKSGREKAFESSALIAIRKYKSGGLVWEKTMGS